MTWLPKAAAFVTAYSSSTFFVEIQTAEIEDPTTGRKIPGKLGIGSAFNIGCGYFATARHIVEGNLIRSFGRNESRDPAFVTSEIEGIFYHQDRRVDIAIIKIAETNLHPILQLDPVADANPENEHLLQDVVVMGYPPIPWASKAHLVALQGEVSAVIESRIDGRRNFVISGMARGGFSGGPVSTVGTPNRVLGIVTTALIGGADKAEELGFLAATSAVGIFETVDQNSLKISQIEMSLKGFIAPP
jgi:hypothetical protein